MSKLSDAFEAIIGDRRTVIFDYDSTIARVPIDWPAARVRCRAYLAEHLAQQLAGVTIPDDARVDEMEVLAVTAAPRKADLIFQFRYQEESVVDGHHEPIDETVDLIRDLAEARTHRLYIISNNLHRTVDEGLQQLRLTHAFEAVLGVDDAGVPKPRTRAFEILQEEADLSARDCVFIGDNDRTDGGFCSALGISFLNVKAIDESVR